MVGDSVYDIAAGRAAGVRTVAVTYGYGVGDLRRRRTSWLPTGCPNSSTWSRH